MPREPGKRTLPDPRQSSCPYPGLPSSPLVACSTTNLAHRDAARQDGNHPISSIRARRARWRPVRGRRSRRLGSGHIALPRGASRPWFVRSCARDPLFYPTAESRAVGLEIGCVDHDGRRLSCLGRQAFHHLSQRAHSAHRFQRLYNVLCGPYSLGASRQRRPFRLTKMIQLRTCRSSTRGLP